jgi:mono/diheme cytochrome c family protein
MKRISIYVVAGLFLGITLVATESVKGDDYAQGKKLYSDKCQICHGEKGNGNGPAASALSPKPADFTDPRFWQGDVNKKITETVENGHGMMPAFNLKPEEIKDIINYITHTFKPTR